MSRIVDFKALTSAVKGVSVPVSRGRVTAAGEIVVDAELAGARVGMRVVIRSPDSPEIVAEVASCDGSAVRLLPLARAPRVGHGDQVSKTGTEGTI